jgi:hypothetical protein
MPIRRVSWIALPLALTLCPMGAAAAPPNRINFQGLALDPSGIPIQGSQSMIIRIWDDPVSLAPAAFVYGEQHAGVAFLDGVFQIVIGAGAPISGALDPSTFSQSGRWVELQIGSEILAPRQRVESNAYALQCANSDSVGGVAGASLITGVSAGTGLAGGGSAGDVSLSLGANGVGAAQIIDSSITSADVADGSITSADIAANTITGFDLAFNSVSSATIADGQIFEQDIANEAGVGFTESSTPVIIDFTSNILLATTISAPSDGFIVANASLSARLQPATGLECSLTLDTLAHDNSAEVVEYNLETTYTAQESLSLTRGFTVSAPGSRVVRLICRAGDAQIDDRQLTAIFAPTGY